jgi:hypothetical protein
MADNIYSVFMDGGRHTCIRVAVGRRYTSFIPMEADAIAVKRLPHDSFNQHWKCYNEYPVQRAAWHYLKSIAAQMSITTEANAYLAALQDAKTEEDFAAITASINQLKEQIMEATEKTTAPATTKIVKPSAPKAPAKGAAKPAAKPAAKAPAKGAAKPAAKAPAKGAAKPTTKAPAKGEQRGPRGQFAGKAIKRTADSKTVLASIREGSVRAALMAAIVAETKADSAIGKTYLFDKEQRTVTSTDLATAVKIGLITVQ